ncbi:PQQ-dependent sugar dehydrogenase [Temperatibacter marinus]|uniref:PQQ-dependent sugar dehydrogenase n=1 Tax=Temperatibacter marinus TaxID=1456591 RepID=A0AA52EFE8_9PROT|nr:PQQ-dependent sugar dehydrogenase [Temperatibacter marinus]WND01840.1 PQQ-dependent sugar dehydrogenase [Temperatibacter marinus]
MLKFIAVALLLHIGSYHKTYASDESLDISKLYESHGERFRLELVSSGFSTPWSMTFLSNDKALIGERSKGALTLLDLNTGDKMKLKNLPPMVRSASLSAGLFDLKIKGNWVYFAYAVGTDSASGLAVAKARLEGPNLKDIKVLYETPTKRSGKWHFGGRLVLTDHHIYLSVGDGYDFRDLAQSLDNTMGKILRLNLDGTIPKDNPFLGNGTALPEIYAYGSRNAQGMALHPDTGEIWFNEHGPQGGDEINILRPGTNYGWPVITFGEEYGGGKIGEGTHKEGMAQPLHFWTPSIAPSGMTFYSGSRMKKWKNHLFIGALAKQHLNHITLKGRTMAKENRLFEEAGWRIRFVEESPDGFLYIANDTGMIMRIIPEN